MKIYREGREIYEIKDYKQIGKFMEVATIEATIKSALPIDIQVGDYVIFDYNNLKYTLYDVYPAKKQARSSTYGEAFVYDLKFKADTEHLSICPFLDLVPNDNNLTYSSLPSFSTFENVYGIADRLQANLDYLYPNQWRFDVVETTDAELLETLSDAREFAISGESCLEGLRKIYDIWGVGFIHSVEDGVNVITIGKSAGKTSLFRYGKGRGLRTIKKNLQNSDQLCTRAYVFGSTRNIPARWYNNKGYIGEAQYAPNLMIPPSKWADGIPQGAYIDAVFDGVNRIEKYGLKIKTLSYDGSDSKKDEIYPSVEKMTAKIIRDAKAEIGENTYIPSPTLYPDNERMDMVLEGSNITDDGTNSEPGYVLHSDKIIKSIEGESETITIAEKKGESKYELDRSIQRNINICVFDIEKPANYRIRERLDFVTFKKNDLESTISAILTLQTPSGEYIELRKLAFTDKLEDSLQIPDSVHELKEAGKYTLILKLGVTWTTDWVVPQIGEDVYLTYNIAETDITLSRGERILDNFFTIKIKQIGFDINDYTASSGAFKNIHFRSGMCSGMSFNIAKCNYIEEIDAWELKCRRVEDSSISQRFPNSIFNIAKDDRFVLLDINMPDLYVYTAMQRLYDTALEDLKHFSTPQYVIEPQIDNIQMARSPQVLKEGMYMAIDDLDIAILNEEALIDSVTITNRGTALRSFEVTLRNDKVYNRYNKLADRIADLESAAQKTASNSTITPVQDTSESKIETPAVGFDENALADYLEENKYTTEGDVTNLLSPIDKEVSTLRTDFDNLNTLLNGNVGGVIDTWNEVVDFLDGYKDSEDLATILSGMNTDIANRVLIEDFEKLEEAVNPLFGYFDANGNANNALKLGGHSAEYFATADALNTHITAFNNYKTATDNRLKDLEALWYMDAEGNVHTTHNIVVDKGGAFGMGAESGDVPSASVSIKFDGSTIVYSPVDGIITLPAYPSGGGGVADSVDWSNISGKPNFATVATSGKYSDLSGTPTIPTSLKSPYALTFGSKTYDGSSAKTILASDLGALTAHQTIYSLTINNSAGTAQVTYTPNSKATSLTLTKSMVGLSNVENTALSTWAGSSKITTLGTITSGTWNGTKIANSYLANSSMTIAGTSVSLGSSITAATLKTNLGLGSFAYISSLAFSSLTGKPTTLAGYGITDALSVNGGTITGGFGALSVKRNVAYGSAIRFENTNGVLGHIGIENDGVPKVWNSTGTVDYVLLHSGNYSSYALPLSGGTLTGSLTIDKNDWAPIVFNRGGTSAFIGSGVSLLQLGFSEGYLNIGVNELTYATSGNLYGVIHSGNIGAQSVNYANSAGNADTLGGYSNSSYFAYRGWSDQNANEAKMGSYFTYSNNAPHTGPLAVLGADGYDLQLNAPYIDNNYYLSFRTRNGDYGYHNPWVTLARVDGNVASATKLQTARSIWGQSFDGTSDVSGNILLGVGSDYVIGTGYSSSDKRTFNNITIGNSTNGIVYNGGTWTGSTSFNAHTFNTGASANALVINNSGNVLIGTIDDNGAKLQVSGSVTINNGEWAYFGVTRGNLGSSSIGGIDPSGVYFSHYMNGVETYMYLKSGVGLTIHSNLTVTGGGAFGSDIRYKDIIAYQQLDLETIVNAPLFTFKWTDREDKATHLGTSAQYWLGTQAKDAVNITNPKFYHLDYGALAVGIGISVARGVKGVKTEVQLLREKVNQLEKELAQYRRA